MARQTKNPADRYDILMISDDVVGEKMAGPGIRAWELSRVLSKEFNVILAVPDYSPGKTGDPFFEDLPFRVIRYAVGDNGLIEKLGEKSRIIILQGYVLSKFPVIKKLKAVLVVDLYVPFVLENMFVHQWKIPNLEDREAIHRNDLRVFHELLLSGDHFLCANDRQKDLFLGSLLSLNRIHPQTLDDSPSLDKLISVVPFGLSAEKEVVPGPATGEGTARNLPYRVSEDDVLFLWGGVISNWFDPLTLIQAFRQALSKNAKLKLLFLSTIHPNPLLPEFDMAKEAVRLAADLGLKDTHVFFNKDWVRYRERGAFFRQADVGVSIHRTNFETYFAFRTRILDYLKHDLPMLCTKGDFFAELVEKRDLGLTVPAGDVEELSQAILRLADDRELREKMKARVRLAKADFYWEKVAEPLVRFCHQVLDGSIASQCRMSGRDFFDTFRTRQTGLVRRAGKSRFLWPFLQRLPFRISIKLKRLWK
jgi:glycosyltransferase involved in cell wall biosynthesis